MTVPVEIELYKAPSSIGRAKDGKTLWAVDKTGPWVEVEDAVKAFLERRGWQVEYGVMFNATVIINAALFTIFRDDKAAPCTRSLISSGQHINRVDNIAGHMFDKNDKDAFSIVYKAFQSQGIKLEGPLQFIKLVLICSQQFNDTNASTRELFFAKVGRFLNEETVDRLQSQLEKWVLIYTRKVRRQDAKKGFRLGEPIDPDFAFLRLRSFIYEGRSIDFYGYKDRFNLYEMRTRLKNYKRRIRDHQSMFNRGRLVSKPIVLPSTDQEIIESQNFRESPEGDNLTNMLIDESRIATFKNLVSNIGMEKTLGIVMGDHEKWSKTRTWFSAGESDLFVSKRGLSYFYEVKSPNDKIHQSQRDFMKYVPDTCGIEYVIGRVKSLQA